MRKPLEPKPTSRNATQRELRLRLLSNGWTPIPCQAKREMLVGWPKVHVDRQQIIAWDSYGKDADGNYRGTDLKGTGLRLEGDILVLDLDIHDQKLLDEVLDAVEDSFPEWFAGALWRHSGAVSMALFGRVSKPIRSRPHRIYGHRLANGEVVDKAHCEIHGSLSRRYFAGWGPHKEPDREYQWHGPSPETVRLDELPVLPEDQVGPLLDCVEAVLARHLEQIDTVTVDAPSAYDLTPETLFQIHNGDLVELGALEQSLEDGTLGGVYGVLETEKDVSDSGTRHHAFIRSEGFGAGRLIVVDFARNVNHYWADEAVTDVAPELQAAIATLRVERAAPADAPLEEPPVSARLQDIPRYEDDPVRTGACAVLWLLDNVAYYPQAFNGRGGAVSINADGEFPKPISIPALRGSLSRFCWETTGIRGGVHKHNPVEAWGALPEQRSVYGVRMRPDQPWPLFEEQRGVPLLNRYVPPRHPATGGSIEVFKRHMQRLVPDAVERAWVWNWIAWKVQNPWCRGVGLAMIAREHGSGRGLFAETLGRLFGVEFVISLPYDSITGGTKFNAEVEGRLLVYVNEARQSDSHRFGPKNAAKEALRVFIEPNHRERQRIEPKGVDAYYTLLAVSTLIFANSVKAVPIDEHDRRTVVVTNGRQMTPAERKEYQFGWMNDPANIGALYRQLRDFKVERDEKVFDPYMAPEFVGRDQMIEAGQSPLERAWTIATAKLGEGAHLYTMSQVTRMTCDIAKSHYPDFADLVRGHTFEHGFRIGIKRPTEKNWRIRHGADLDDNRQPVFATDAATVARWTAATTEEIQAELDEAQKVVDRPGDNFRKTLRIVKDV